MKHSQLTNWEAIKIGLVFSAGIALLLFMIHPAILHIKIFAMNAPITLLLFGIAGAFIGKFLSKSRQGTWLGAGVMILLLGLWLYVLASNPPLD
jgi:cytochrome c biogenesis protein CcdA